MYENVLYMDTTTVLPVKLFFNILYGKFAMPEKKKYNHGRFEIYQIK